MNSKIAFFALILLLITTLFFLQRSQTSINESNQILQEIKKILGETKNSDSKPTKKVDSDYDPSEDESYIAVEANISTEISRGTTGKIDLENYWPFTRQIDNVALEDTVESLTSFPSLVPPVQQLGLNDIQSYSGPANNVVVIDGAQRYIEVSAAANETTGIKLFKIQYQVKYSPCECWSDYHNGYLSIKVN